MHKDVFVTIMITEESEETRWSSVDTGDLKNLMKWLKEKSALKM